MKIVEVHVEKLATNLQRQMQKKLKRANSKCMGVTSRLDLPSVVATSGPENKYSIQNKIKKLAINLQRQMPINSKKQTSKTMVVTSMLELPSVVVTSGA